MAATCSGSETSASTASTRDRVSFEIESALPDAATPWRSAIITDAAAGREELGTGPSDPGCTPGHERHPPDQVALGHVGPSMATIGSSVIIHTNASRSRNAFSSGSISSAYFGSVVKATNSSTDSNHCSVMPS